MGMSTHVVAFISDDDPTYQKHKKISEVCMEADVSLPKETAEYFGCGTEKLDEFQLDDMLSEKLEIEIKTKEWGDDGRSGYEIDVTKLPKEVHKIRFYNSW